MVAKLDNIYVTTSAIRCHKTHMSIRLINKRMTDIPFVENSSILEVIFSGIGIPTSYFWEDNQGEYENILNGEYIYAILNYMRDLYEFKPLNKYFKEISYLKFSELPLSYQEKINYIDTNIQIMDARTPVEARKLIERLKGEI